jgi:BirA family biotin operon repressor/biotin-[acetyl-CoA-carboxylase] ligase
LTEWQPGITAGQALGQVAAPLVQSLLAFEQTGFAPLQARFEARDVLKGHRVHTSDGAQGLSLGVSPGGALRLQTDSGVLDIHSSEVSVRPFPAEDKR